MILANLAFCCVSGDFLFSSSLPPLPQVPLYGQHFLTRANYLIFDFHSHCPKHIRRPRSSASCPTVQWPRGISFRPILSSILHSPLPSSSPHNHRLYHSLMMLKMSTLKTLMPITPTIPHTLYANNLHTLSQTKPSHPLRGPKLFVTSAEIGTGILEYLHTLPNEL